MQRLCSFRQRLLFERVLIIENKNVMERYNLPEEVKFCKKCTISNQRPRITFDENGVCSACNFSEFKRHSIDWTQREQELKELCDMYRSKDGSYDVVVPCSGGKDGSYVAHQLKYKYNMRPLTVTWAPLSTTEIGTENLKNFIDSGFDNILGSTDGQIKRLLTKLSFIHLGDPFQPFIYGQVNFPVKVAVQNNIHLIMYGENGEVEYGGDMKNAYRPDREINDSNTHYFSGLPPEFWNVHGISKEDLYPYQALEYEKIMNNRTKIHFYSYYKFWNPFENFEYCCKNTGFKGSEERNEGTYVNFASLDDKIDGFHYYLSYIKFGLGRATADTAHEIRDGKISREQGIELVKKYDGEFPKKYFDYFLWYCGISEKEFWEVIDSWRSPHIWKNEYGKWSLKNIIE